MQNTAASFREVQHFRGAVIWWVTLVSVVIGTGGAVWAVLVEPVPVGWLFVLLIVGVAVVVMWVISVSRMETEVHADGLHLRYIPFIWRWRVHTWADIASYEAVTYKPIMEYGGWGLRYGRKGRALNVKGNRGVQLEFTDGKRLLVGSQQPEALVAAMQAASANGGA